MSGIGQTYHYVKSAGRPVAARLSRWQSMAQEIIRRSERLSDKTETELLKLGHEMQWRAKTGQPLNSLLLDAYALVREAACRAVGMKHYPVQLMGGIALFEGHIAEMQTGEGKTLTATLPSYIRALPGKGCHVITVNDYLAKRDAEIMGPIYKQLGLTYGCILSPMETDDRRPEYAKSITYGTAKEMGFDFLRDRLRMGVSFGSSIRRHRQVVDKNSAAEAPVQQDHYFALVDEADSILIDEARTPLIIGLTQPNDPSTVNLFRWAQRATHQLTVNQDFIYEPDRRSAYLTDKGCRKVLLMAKPAAISAVDTERIYTQVERALTARYGFQKDRDYVVIDKEVAIVDESTGRIMDGRKWQDGLHQAIEAKEMVPITAGTGQAARITVQEFFMQYSHLAGMTGTAVQSRREVWKTFHIPVTPIPTHRPCIRKGYPPRMFATMQAKRQAIVQEVETLVKQGRAVLIGTPSVEASESLGKMLLELDSKFPLQILNAKYHEIEADIVAQAGKPGRVTIATNMAGRGTDIILDEDVRTNGGLHIIATELHTSKRIDRQLIGRAARQGDPGTYQFFLSLEDELLRCLDPKKLLRIVKSANPNADGELPASWYRFFTKTQRYLERMHLKQRNMLLKQEKMRTQTYLKMGLDPYLELTE